jgi:hypothetical protein
MSKHSLWFAVVALVVVGCEGGASDQPHPEDAVLSGQLGVTLAPVDPDVSAVRVNVVPGDQPCTATAVKSVVAKLLDDRVLAPRHPFTDVLFVLPVGTFRVCAVPLDAQGNPSGVCAPTDGLALVVEGATTEVELTSQCKSPPRGGLDTVVQLNHAPVIDGLSIAPSKFLFTCETATISVTASDADRDFPRFAFSQVSGPAGATLESSGSTATFRPTVDGEYVLRVTVSDGRDGEVSLTFPIHVSPGTTSCP